MENPRCQRSAVKAKLEILAGQPSWHKHQGENAMQNVGDGTYKQNGERREEPNLKTVKATD